MKCTTCGKELDVSDNFCSYCGARSPKINYAPCILAAEQGELRAFEELYHMTKNTYSHYIKIKSKNQSIAEDLLQESYLQIFEQLVIKKQLKNRDAFISWGKTIVNRTVCNYYTRTKYETYEILPDITKFIDFLQGDDLRKDCDPESIYIQKETSETLYNIIDSLPPNQKQCILLWMNSRTVYEISEILGMPSGTVKSNILYAKRKIKAKLKDLETKEGN